VIDDTTVLTLLALGVPGVVTPAVGYVKRGRQIDRQGTKIDQLIGLAEDGKREHDELKSRIGALERQVSYLEGRLRNGARGAGGPRDMEPQ